MMSPHVQSGDCDHPQMSVIMITPDNYEHLRPAIRRLQRQTVREQLELVIVAPSAKKLGLDRSELLEFAGVQVVRVDEITSTGEAVAAGFRQSTASVVTYLEEHVYPEVDWAEALIEAHQQPWAAVGPVIDNANPWTRLSWAHLYIDFGPWVGTAGAGESDGLPWHNTAYKRDVLSAYGPDLPMMLEVEGILHGDLKANGLQLYLESSARVYHINPSLFRPFARASFLGGRLFGARRADQENWSIYRRLLYLGALPLIPAVRLRRTLGHIHRSGRGDELLPQVLPALSCGLVFHALGEVTGYMLGVGDSARLRLPIELNRLACVTEQDRRALSVDGTET